jgi:hypothetical protein
MLTNGVLTFTNDNSRTTIYTFGSAGDPRLDTAYTDEMIRELDAAGKKRDSRP